MFTIDGRLVDFKVSKFDFLKFSFTIIVTPFTLCIDTIKNSNLNSKTVEKALSTSIINLSNAFNENKLNSNEKMQVLNLMNKQTDCIMEIEKDNKILRNVLIATTFVTLVGTTVYKACNNRK